MTAGHIENSNSPYLPIRSAFTVIEKPLRFFYARYHTHYDPLQSLKDRFYLGGMVVYPIVICATPVTMVADVAIGIAECIFCTFVRGDSLRDVAELARKKIVVSPLHHLTFIITSLTPSALYLGYLLQIIVSMPEGPKWAFAKTALIFATGLAAFWISTPLLLGDPHDNKVFLKIPASLQPFNQNRLLYMAVQTFFIALALRNFVFLELHTAPWSMLLITSAIPLAIASLVWIFSYTLSQRMIGSFSPSWNHQAFSIFINRGAQIKQVGTGFQADGINRKPGMTFQDVGFTDSDLTYWKDRYARFWTEQRCPRHN